MSRRVTMAEVAKRAQVHKSTVSLAIRGHRSIPESTRQRISALAKEMGYRPDPTLSALVDYRTGKDTRRFTPTLAYMTNWDSCWGWSDLPTLKDHYEGAKEQADELGYRLEHLWLGEPDLTHRRMNDILCNRNIEGVVFAAFPPAAAGPLNLDWSRLCAIRIDLPAVDPPLHSVAGEYSGLVRLAVWRALNRGYRRIGLWLEEDWDRAANRAWSGGFVDAQATLPPHLRLPIFNYGHDEIADPSTVLRRLARWREEHKPEVVLGYGPVALKWAREFGASVPHDFAFIDIHLEGEESDCAGLYHHSKQVGRTAIDVLANQLKWNRHGIPAVATSTHVDGSWQDGPTLPRRQGPREDWWGDQASANLVLGVAGD